MAGPRDIIRRASERHIVTGKHPAQRVCAPAPMQFGGVNGVGKQDFGASAHFSQDYDKPTVSEDSVQVQCESSTQTPSTRMPVAQNIGGHAIYRELMRSHDRMGTRHIGPKG